MICLRETHVRHTAYRTSAEAWEFSGNQSAVYRKGFLKRNTQGQACTDCLMKMLWPETEFDLCASPKSCGLLLLLNSMWWRFYLLEQIRTVHYYLPCDSLFIYSHSFSCSLSRCILMLPRVAKRFLHNSRISHFMS